MQLTGAFERIFTNTTVNVTYFSTSTVLEFFEVVQNCVTRILLVSGQGRRSLKLDLSFTCLIHFPGQSRSYDRVWYLVC